MYYNHHPNHYHQHQHQASLFIVVAVLVISAGASESSSPSVIAVMVVAVVLTAVFVNVAEEGEQVKAVSTIFAKGVMAAHKCLTHLLYLSMPKTFVIKAIAKTTRAYPDPKVKILTLKPIQPIIRVSISIIPM